MLHRLSLLHKFLILGVIALLMGALPTVLYVRGALQQIGAARYESQGAPALIAVNQAVQRLQVHRGLSAAMLGGDEVLAARRPAARDALNQAFAEAGKAFAQAGVPQAQVQAWSAATQTWQSLEQAVATRSLQPPQSLAQHTQLVGTLMQIGEELLHHYGFQTDPDMATQDLIQAAVVNSPMLGEKLGLLRGQGSGYLARQALPPEGKGALQALQQRVGELEADTFRNFERALADEDLRKALAGPVQDVRQRVAASRQLVDRSLLSASEITMPAKDYFDQLTGTLEALNQLNTTAMASLDAALLERVSADQRKLGAASAALLLALALGLGLGMVFMRSITQPLAPARRNVLGTDAQPQVATAMLLQAVQGGAQAAGHLPSPGAQAGLVSGVPADFVALDPEHIALRGLPPESQLSAHVFASHRTSAIDAVWTSGVQRVASGRHALHGESAAAFAAVRSGLLQT